MVSHSSWEHFFCLTEDIKSPVKASFPHQSLSSVPGGAWLGECRDAPRKSYKEALCGAGRVGHRGSPASSNSRAFSGSSWETDCWVLCFHRVRFQAGASPCPESALVSHSWSSLGQALPELDIRPPPRVDKGGHLSGTLGSHPLVPGPCYSHLSWDLSSLDFFQ